MKKLGNNIPVVPVSIEVALKAHVVSDSSGKRVQCLASAWHVPHRQGATRFYAGKESLVAGESSPAAVTLLHWFDSAFNIIYFVLRQAIFLIQLLVNLRNTHTPINITIICKILQWNKLEIRF